MKYPSALNPLRGTQFSWLLPLTWSLLKCAAVTAPITLEVFLHHRFGARTGRDLIKGFLLLLVMAPIFKGAFPTATVPLFTAFIFAYVGCALWHWFDSRFGVRNEHAHSLQNGEPRLCWELLPFSQSIVRCYLEPSLCFLASLILISFNSALSHWVLVATIALFIKAQLRHHDIRTRQLDALDGRIESTERAPRPRAEHEPFVEARPAPPRRMANAPQARGGEAGL